MDVKDKKILYELANNSRISLNSLAKKVGLNKTTTHYRMKKLDENKTILGYHTIIDYSKLGLGGFRCYLNFQNTTPQKEENILSELAKSKYIHVLARNIGFADIIFISWVKTPLEAHNLIKYIKENYHNELEVLEISPYVKAHHFNRGYLIGEENKEVISTGGSVLEELDELDYKILEKISDNARNTIVNISRSLNSDVRTIIKRIKKLEDKKVIAGYSINLNIEALGFEYHKLNIIFNKNIKYNELLSFASSIPNTVFVDETTSKYDFELNLEVKNHQEVEEIIKKIKSKYPDIKEIKSFKLKKFEKFVYMAK